jgi:hypothetical protein
LVGVLLVVITCLAKPTPYVNAPALLDHMGCLMGDHVQRWSAIKRHIASEGKCCTSQRSYARGCPWALVSAHTANIVSPKGALDLINKR